MSTSASERVCKPKKKSVALGLLVLVGRAQAFTSFSSPRVLNSAPSRKHPSMRTSTTDLHVFRKNKSHTSSNHSTSTIALPMFLGSAAPFGLGTLATSISSAASSGSTFLATIFETPVADPMVEAELLSGLSHIASDLLTFLGPATIIIRVAALVGRILSMAADYAPDHFMFPEEFAFQSLMLGATWVGLVKASMPLAFASFKSDISLRDGKAFSALFEPAGLSWSQYKALSFCALDWINVEAGDVITSDETDQQGNEDEYIYWLYSGEAEVQSNGTTVLNVAQKDTASLKKNAGRGLLGEVRLLRRMESARIKKKKSIGSKTSELETSNAAFTYPRTTIKAGSSGAVLLRIHTPNLKMLMDADPQFADSIRTLLLQGMQAKLMAQLETLASSN